MECSPFGYCSSCIVFVIFNLPKHERMLVTRLQVLYRDLYHASQQRRPWMFKAFFELLFQNTKIHGTDTIKSVI